MSRNIVCAKFTRPADTTAYASGDLIANSTTAGSVVPMSLPVQPGPIQIRRVKVSKSGTGVTNASVRLHLFSVAAPTVANGDNAAFSSAKAANYMGQVDVTIGQAFTDGAVGWATTEINADVAGTIYALLEARGAYTPANAEVFTLQIEAV